MTLTPLYSFTDRKRDVSVFLAFSAFDLFWGFQYVAFGSFVLIGGRLAYLSQGVESVLLVVFLFVGTVFFGIRAVYPTKTEFYEDYIMFSNWHSWSPISIPYAETTRMVTKSTPSVGIGRENVNYYIRYRSKDYSIPVRFETEAASVSFVKWFETKTSSQGQLPS